MAKKKETYRRRKRKVGLGEIAVAAAAIAHFTRGKVLKNSVTDAVRVGLFNPLQSTTGQSHEATAIIGLLGYQMARREINKAQLNPMVGPVRLL